MESEHEYVARGLALRSSWGEVFTSAIGGAAVTLMNYAGSPGGANAAAAGAAQFIHFARLIADAAAGPLPEVVSRGAE